MYSNEQAPVTNPGQMPPMPQHQAWILFNDSSMMSKHKYNLLKQISYAPPPPQGNQPIHQQSHPAVDQSGYVPNLPTVPTHEPQPAHQPVAEPPAQEPVAEAQLISFD